MMAVDEDALICDLAEAYHVHNWRKLPVHHVAILAWGLSTESRIKRKLSGAPAPIDTLLLAMAVDRLSLLVWANTKDAQRGRNRPPSIVDKLIPQNESEITGFDTAEDYERVRARILGMELEHGERN